MTAPLTRAARHGRIVELIRDKAIHSQTELADLLAGDGDQPVLHPGRGIVHDDHRREDRHRRQQRRCPLAGAEHGAVDAVPHGERYRELRARCDEHGRDALRRSFERSRATR